MRSNETMNGRRGFPLQYRSNILLTEKFEDSRQVEIIFILLTGSIRRVCLGPIAIIGWVIQCQFQWRYTGYVRKQYISRIVSDAAGVVVSGVARYTA